MKQKSSTQFKYYTTIAMVFITLLLTANVVGEKQLLIGGSLIIPMGFLIFPMTYLLGDILTEVYGFWNARRVIWMGMFCSIFLAMVCRIAIALPFSQYWHHQEAYAKVLGISSRLMVISVFTYFVGEFINAVLVAKLKVLMKGKRFWIRALFGSWIGEFVETSLFIPLFFYGTLPWHLIIKITFIYYGMKMAYAACAMPFINYLVKIIKKREEVEIYDRKISFNPFSSA